MASPALPCSEHRFVPLRISDEDVIPLRHGHAQSSTQ
jgi:hypothetical protein